MPSQRRRRGRRRELAPGRIGPKIGDGTAERIERIGKGLVGIGPTQIKLKGDPTDGNRALRGVSDREGAITDDERIPAPDLTRQLQSHVVVGFAGRHRACAPQAAAGLFEVRDCVEGNADWTGHGREYESQEQQREGEGEQAPCLPH